MVDSTPRSSSGYPLVALFLILTACGIVAALIGPAVRAVSAGHVGVVEAVSSAGIGSAVVAVTGAVVGMFHYRRGRGLLCGLLVGGTLGLFVGPLTLAPAEAFGAIVALSFGGSVVIVVLGASFHLASRRTDRS